MVPMKLWRIVFGQPMIGGWRSVRGTAARTIDVSSSRPVPILPVWGTSIMLYQRLHACVCLLNRLGRAWKTTMIIDHVSRRISFALEEAFLPSNTKRYLVGPTKTVEKQGSIFAWTLDPQSCLPFGSSSRPQFTSLIACIQRLEYQISGFFAGQGRASRNVGSQQVDAFRH